MFHSLACVVVLLISSTSLAASSSSSSSSSGGISGPHEVPGEYIVKFRKDAQAHFARMRGSYAADFHPDLGFIHHPRSSYMAMYGRLDDEQLERVKEMDGVDYVQHNFRYQTQLDTPAAAPTKGDGAALLQDDDDDEDDEDDDPYEEEFASSWGLDRSDQQFLPLNGVYRFFSNGTGVSAFVLDTGVNKDHPDWRSDQVEFLADCTGLTNQSHIPSVDPGDPNGDGTHVAGTIASASFGLAKAAQILSIRVLGANGSGYTPGIVNALEYAIEYARFRPTPRYVINLSLGSDNDTSLNEKIDDAWAAGIVVVAAAGNEAKEACYSSPASADNVIAVGASTIADSVASYSNFGSCVDIFAPGDSILSLNANFEADGSLSVLSSGTSMSSPHVAGAAALVLDLFPEFTPDQVEAALTDSSTAVVAHVLPATTNKLLYTFDESLEPDHDTLTTYQLIMIGCGAVLGLCYLSALWYCLCRRPPKERARRKGKFYHRFEDDPLQAASMTRRQSSLNQYNPPRAAYAQPTFAQPVVSSSGRSPEY